MLGTKIFLSETEMETAKHICDQADDMYLAFQMASRRYKEKQRELWDTLGKLHPMINDFNCTYLKKEGAVLILSDKEED